MHDCRGFSLIEVLLGITIFMIGMLGVTALNISSLKSNTFSGNLSEATLIAATKIEELMAIDFDGKDLDSDGKLDVNEDTNGNHNLDAGEDLDGDDKLDVEENPLADVDGDGTDQEDADDDGVDDDGGNFGLDDTGTDADYNERFLGKNGMYTVYWNVAENEPISLPLQRTKIINVIVEWYVKDEPRRISMDFIRMKEE